MGKPQGRSKKHRHNGSTYGFKGRKFDTGSMIDVVYDDIRLGRKKDLEVDFDKPGMGQIYCIACAKYFKDEEVLAEHNRTKPHKRRLKALQRSPHRGEDLPVKND